MAVPLRPTPVNPKDVLGVDALYDGEELMLRDSVRRFVGERVLPGIMGWYEEGVFPQELAREMGSLGLLGMHLEGYGCAGASATQYGIACMELEAGDSGFRSFVSVQGSLAMFPIRAFGSDEQKQRWLPLLASGEAIGCFGLTEHDSGSDPGSMTTTARRDGDDWVINGGKMWITNGSLADVAIVWAVDTSSKKVRGFVVPTDTPGFQANKVEHKMSLRASMTSELVFTDMRLPGDAVLPHVEGLKGPLACLNEARFGILWGAVGAARACYESALDYSTTREQFGVPIAKFQLTQQKLVEMMLGVNKAHMVALHLGRMKDAGTLSSTLVSFGKLDNVRVAMDVARTARGIHGGSGITGEYPIMRHMANLESVYTYEGTNEIHTLILGQAITGHSAF
jgi:glutaryl-CoA dehydrogenase